MVEPTSESTENSDTPNAVCYLFTGWLVSDTIRCIYISSSFHLQYLRFYRTLYMVKEDWGRTTSYQMPK